MKNIKKIIALLCITLLALSSTCFAFTENQAINFLLKADNNTITAGSTVDVTLYAENLKGNTNVDYGTYYFYFNDAQFECVGSVKDSSYAGYNSKVGVVIENATTLNYENIATYTFTAKSDLTAGSYKICAYELAFMDADGNINDVDEELCTAEISITVTGAKPTPTYPNMEEETFTEAGEVNGIPVTAEAKAWTVFQKTSTNLDKNTYGLKVVNDGKTYTFPGLSDVKIEDGKSEALWAIKIVAPTQKFADNVDFAPTSIKAYVGTTLSGELMK